MNIMEHTIIDKDCYYAMAFSAFGFKFEKHRVEVILQVSKIVSEEKGLTSLKDIFETRFDVYRMFGLDEHGMPIDTLK